MITGFNTDIEHDGITYHVQTEDKGPRTPMILSLIYVGGTILASRRAPYRDLLKDVNFGEKDLRERLQRQHKLICAAISAGRIEDLKKMHEKKSPSGVSSAVLDVESANAASRETSKERVLPPTRPTLDKTPEHLLLVEKNVGAERLPESALSTLGKKIPKPNDGLVFEVPEILSEPVIEEVVVIEEEMILPAEAVIILNDQIAQKSLGENKLTISLINQNKLKSGAQTTINILVGRGGDELGVAKAHVVVKILGSTFRPLIFHAKTDSNGVAAVQVQLPNFKTGRAVLFVRAMSGGEESEFRNIISQA